MRRKIVNPFTSAGPELFGCFGCSPYNPIGLNLSFYEDGDCVFANWMPDKNFEGYKGVLHGGIQATLMDEIASWFIYTQIGTAGVTKRIDVEYFTPIRITGEPVLIKAGFLEQMENNEVIILAELFYNDKLCASARVIYFIFPESIAKGKYNYPGIDSFFDANKK